MSAALFARLARWEAERRDFVLCTLTDTGGSTPRLAGAQMGVTADDFTGTVGGGAFELRVLEEARALLADPGGRTHRLEVHLVRDLGMCCGGKMSVFFTRVAASPRLWIFGAGHVGTALAHVAHLTGFTVTVVDARAEWADPARFATGIEVRDAEPEDLLTTEPPGAQDAVVVVTHSHPLDESLVRRLAERPLAFLGLIGSRGKWARFRNRLLERGISSEALDRVRCPVGLDIGAVTPEEIALSIVAELVARRRSKP